MSVTPDLRAAYASVVLDVDSTLCGIEGIDFLARRRGPGVGAEIARVTDRAMRGELPLDRIYGERLTVIQPTLADIAALAEAYARALAPGAADAIAVMRAAGIHIVLVSGGIRQAIEPVARTLGLAEHDLVAVSLSFDADGRYAGFDERSHLTRQAGKAAVLTELLAASCLSRPLLAVGDGATDAAMAGIADTFAAFTGFARRTNVLERADLEITSFAELLNVTVVPAE